MNYKGVIILESLDDESVLKDIKIISTRIEQVTDKHKTPWLTKWTLHTIEIPEEKGDDIAQKINISLDKAHEWYADYKNDKYHFIIYRRKVFKVDLTNPILYKAAKNYGVSAGIPEYQVDFV